MSENKSIGGALVDVFDAAVSLVKSEINAVTRRVTSLAKAKGLGVVLVLASIAPLMLALIFMILFVFYGLMRLGLGAWAAALLIAIFSFIVTGVLVMMGIKKLTAEVPEEAPRRHSEGRPAGSTPASGTVYDSQGQPHTSAEAAKAQQERAERVRQEQHRKAEEARKAREEEKRFVSEHGISVSTQPTYEQDIRKEHQK